MPRPIVIIGSINMDLVCRTSAIPRPGETVLGEAFATIPGGKGANQAVAAARVADGRMDVHMIGRVGDDEFGRRLLGGLRENRVITERVTVTRGAASGVAMILVDRNGGNSIVVAPGANGMLTPGDIDAAEDLIASASVVVMQLEVPLETVRHTAAMCRRHGVFTILDPAPAPADPLPADLLGVDLLTPNETEAAALSGVRSPTTDAERAADALLAVGAKAVVLKLGAEGSLFATAGGQRHRADGFHVDVVDTTAAGDAFAGALAVAHALQLPPADAWRLANAAGAACCTTFGAQPSLPTRAAVEALLR